MSWFADISVWVEKPEVIQVFGDNGEEQDYVPERTCEVERIERNNPERFDDFFVVLTCGCWFDWADATPPDYCPNCGARVVDE